METNEDIETKVPIAITESKEQPVQLLLMLYRTSSSEPGIRRTAHVLPRGPSQGQMCCGRNVACFTKRPAGGGPLLRVSRIQNWVNEHVSAHLLIYIFRFVAFLGRGIRILR